MRILLVEDDRAVGSLLRRVLAEDGWAVDLVHTGTEGRELARSNDYAGVVLDLDLPDISGLEILRDLRDGGRVTPVLIVSGITREEAVVHGLDAGADDYLRKPHSNEEFRARVRALVRRGGPRAETLALGAVSLDRLAREVRVGEAAIDLTPTEFGLLEQLLLHAGTVVPRAVLLEAVWGPGTEPGSNAVEVHLMRLRRKLEKTSPRVAVETVRGRGVRIVETPDAEPEGAGSEGAGMPDAEPPDALD